MCVRAFARSSEHFTRIKKFFGFCSFLCFVFRDDVGDDGNSSAIECYIHHMWVRLCTLQKSDCKQKTATTTAQKANSKSRCKSQKIPTTETEREKKNASLFSTHCCFSHAICPLCFYFMTLICVLQRIQSVVNMVCGLIYRIFRMPLRK